MSAKNVLYYKIHANSMFSSYVQKCNNMNYWYLHTEIYNENDSLSVI